MNIDRFVVLQQKDYHQSSKLRVQIFGVNYAKLAGDFSIVHNRAHFWLLRVYVGVGSEHAKSYHFTSISEDDN